jgi:hypothetical protein
MRATIWETSTRVLNQEITNLTDKEDGYSVKKSTLLNLTPNIRFTILESANFIITCLETRVGPNRNI